MIQVISNTQIYQPIKRVFDFISTPENDFQWQYKPIGPYGVNLELSLDNPPSHKATYRISTSDPPSAMKAVVEAIFRKNKKVGKRRNLSETF